MDIYDLSSMIFCSLTFHSSTILNTMLSITYHQSPIHTYPEQAARVCQGNGVVKPRNLLELCHLHSIMSSVLRWIVGCLPCFGFDSEKKMTIFLIIQLKNLYVLACMTMLYKCPFNVIVIS